MLLLAEGVDPSVFERLGVASIVAVILLAGWWNERREKNAERTRNDQLTERLLTLAERALPVLDRVERALDRSERKP